MFFNVKRLIQLAFFYGETFTLTTGADAPQLSSGNDTITGAVGTLNDGDLIVDFSTTDNDTLNATIAADDLAPTIRNIENINLTLDVFTGASATFDATNVLGGTITLSSSKLGYNGAAEVDNVGTNNVTAGSNVTSLTVGGVTTGAINIGNATTASVTTAATTDNVNITVNGDVGLTVATSTATATIAVTADAEITATAASQTTTVINGASNVTILSAENMDGDTITNGLTAGTLTADVAGDAVDASDWDVDVVNLSNTAVNTITVADAQVVNLGVTDTVAITGQSATTGTITVNTAVAQTSLTLATIKTATVNVTDAVTLSTVVAGTAGINFNISDDVTISTLTGGTLTHTATGTGDLTVAAGTAGEFDASGLTGLLDYTQAASAATVVKGGSGNNDVTFAATTVASEYVGQSGNDTVLFATTSSTAEATFTGGANSVSATSLTTGTLTVSGGTGVETVTIAASGVATIALDLGAGNDIVDITGGFGSGSTFAVAFGDGTGDTLKIDTDLSAETLSVTGLEIIDIAGGDNAILSAGQISGKAYTIKGEGTGTSLVVVGGATADTIDLSALTFDATIAKGVDGTTITGNAGKDTVTLNASVADTVVIGDSDSGITVATADTVVGFVSGSDKLKLGTDGDATATTGNYVEASAAVADFAAALTAANTALATLAGTSAAAELYAFQFDATNGYLFNDTDGNGTADQVIVLVGIDNTEISAADIVA